MRTRITRVKNGSIALPREIRKSWGNVDVLVSSTRDSLLIKRLAEPARSLTEMMREFREAARKTKLTRREVHNTIRALRRRQSA